MRNTAAIIRSVKSRHTFACFDLQFVDPTSGQMSDIPGGSLHMVQRGSGVRSVLYYRIENAKFDHVTHDDGVIKDILAGFFKELYSANGVLGDFLPTTSPHDRAIVNPTEETETKTFWTLAQGLWNQVTQEGYTNPVAFEVGTAVAARSGARLNCSFGNGLGFLMTSNPHELYRRSDRLTGKVQFCGEQLHFAFFHSELGGTDLEGILKPDQCVQLLMHHFDRYAPIFRGLEMELKFAD